MTELRADFSDVSDVNVHIVPTGSIDAGVWEDLRQIDYDYLRSNLPRDQWHRASMLTYMGRPDGHTRYVAARTNPTVGTEALNARQRIADPLSAVIFEGQSPIGVVTTANVVSTRTDSDVGLAIKGIFPWWRYANIRDISLNPDYSSEVSGRSRLVSGLLVGALYHNLKERNPSQTLTAYAKEIPSSGTIDRADVGLFTLARLLRMRQDPRPQRKTKVWGYPTEVNELRLTTGVRAAKRTMLALPGGRTAIKGMTVLVQK